MALLDTMISNLVSAGFFQLLFPFLLTLAIVYGVLMSSFKDRLGKGPIGLISIVAGFFVMLYSNQYPWLWVWMTQGFGVWLGIAVTVLLLIITLALLGIKDFKELNWKTAIIVLIVIYVLAVGLLGGTTIGVHGLGFALFSSDIWTIIAFVVILAVVMWFLTREGGGAPKPAEGAPAK